MVTPLFFSEFPIARCGRRSCRTPAPYVPSFFDSLEDHMDQRIGNLFRTLPAVLMQLGRQSSSDSQERGEVRSEPRSKALVSTKDNKFRIQLDTSNFSPQDLNVRVVDGKVHVSAKRESKSSGCYEYQEMQREFSLPEGVDPDTVVSKLSNKGELIIEAPVKAIEMEPAGRSVPIQFGENEPADKSDAAKTDD